MKKTKIVCTIGPASGDKKVFTQMVKNGLNIARLNFSHGDHEEQLARMNMIKEVREELDEPVALLLDTKGPEIRTGKFGPDSVTLQEGQKFTITMDDVMGDETKCTVSYKELNKDMKPGDTILIDDGLVGLTVETIDGNDINCIVQNTGVIKNYKGVNLPGVEIQLPAITPKDLDDILFGIEQGVDFIAASFIRKPEDVLEIRKILEENNAEDIHIISKIENQEGVDKIDEIIRVSDGIMVARGDLGVEIPTERVPLAQKMMINKCNRAGKPVITATQMLDSMIRNPRPTRAETTDVANAIFDGTDAIMLSGETAAGKYPELSVETMSIIAKEAEAALDYDNLLIKRVNESTDSGVTHAVGHATCNTANGLNASAILTATASGFTARRISNFRPKANIVAVTTTDKVRRKLSIMWGVTALKVEQVGTTDEIFDVAVREARKEGLVKKGELVVITAGVPVGVAGATNLMKVHLVGEILIKGLGLGKEVVKGNVCVVNSADEAAEKFNEGDILVTRSTDKDLMDYIKKSSGIIVEEGGYTSHAAIVALNLNKPAIVGAKDATSIIREDGYVTLDSNNGIVYAGETRVL